MRIEDKKKNFVAQEPSTMLTALGSFSFAGGGGDMAVMWRHGVGSSCV
jgi:hypothetical protein